MADKKISDFEEKSLREMQSEDALMVAAVRNRTNYAIPVTYFASNEDINDVNNVINGLEDNFSKDFQIDKMQSDIKDLQVLPGQIESISGIVDTKATWDGLNNKADWSALNNYVNWDAFNTKADVSALDSKVDWSVFPTKADVSAVDLKADKTELDSKANLSDLDDKASKEDVEELHKRVDNIPLDIVQFAKDLERAEKEHIEIFAELESKANKTEINELADQKADRTEINELATAKVDWDSFNNKNQEMYNIVLSGDVNLQTDIDQITTTLNDSMNIKPGYNVWFNTDDGLTINSNSIPEPEDDGLWLRQRETINGNTTYKWVKMVVDENGILRLVNTSYEWINVTPDENGYLKI